MAEQHLITAEFFGSPVSIIDHNGKRWLTAQEVGICLGYNEANARTGVTNLFNRHADEFTEADTCVIKLMTQVQMRETRIFSATGCIKLGFFANTPKAKQFRAWAAQTLEAGGPAPLPQAHGPALPGLKMNRHKERLLMERFAAGETITDAAKALGISRTTASLVLYGKYQFSYGSGDMECSDELIAAVAARHLAIEQERLALMQERIAQRYLQNANNARLALALGVVGGQLREAPREALTVAGGAA